MREPTLPPVHLPINPDAPPVSADDLAHDANADEAANVLTGGEPAGIDREQPHAGDPATDVTLLPPD